MRGWGEVTDAAGAVDVEDETTQGVVGVVSGASAFVCATPPERRVTAGGVKRRGLDWSSLRRWSRRCNHGARATMRRAKPDVDALLSPAVVR